jgi:hypothetical protein
MDVGCQFSVALSPFHPTTTTADGALMDQQRCLKGEALSLFLK